jgi:hypothetical protein
MKRLLIVALVLGAGVAFAYWWAGRAVDEMLNAAEWEG